MSEWLETTDSQPLFSPPDHADDTHSAYDSLQLARTRRTHFKQYDGFSPNSHYASYMNMHKVFVGRKGGRELIEIAKGLQDEWLPDYLDAGGWAAAEASLVCDDLPSQKRIELLQLARHSWERALENQGTLNQTRPQELLCEDADDFRIALNLAFLPMMNAFVLGKVTPKIKDQTFRDILALAQLSAVQLELATKEKNTEAIAAHIGFEYECNAHLSCLYANDMDYISIPSSYRADSGYEYRSQTHDITFINVADTSNPVFYPAEVKAAASLRDRQRYKALIIRAKMHLAIPGRYKPKDTIDAFARCYEGQGTKTDKDIVEHASSTVCDLLDLYKLGEKPEEFKHINTQTNFHESAIVAEKYKELSIIKPALKNVRRVA